MGFGAGSTVFLLQVRCFTDLGFFDEIAEAKLVRFHFLGNGSVRNGKRCSEAEARRFGNRLRLGLLQLRKDRRAPSVAMGSSESILERRGEFRPDPAVRLKAFFEVIGDSHEGFADSAALAASAKAFVDEMLLLGLLELLFELLEVHQRDPQKEPGGKAVNQYGAGPLPNSRSVFVEKGGGATISLPVHFTGDVDPIPKKINTFFLFFFFFSFL